MVNIPAPGEYVRDLFVYTRLYTTWKSGIRKELIWLMFQWSPGRSVVFSQGGGGQIHRKYWNSEDVTRRDASIFKSSLGTLHGWHDVPAFQRIAR